MKMASRWWFIMAHATASMSLTNAFLKRFTGTAKGLEIRVAATQGEVFGATGAGAAAGRIKAAYDPDANRLIVIAANHDRAAGLRTSLQHEILVHKSLGLFSKKIVPLNHA